MKTETFAKLRKAVIPVNTLKGKSTGIQKYLNSLDVVCASEDTGFRRNDRKWLSKLFCKGLKLYILSFSIFILL